MKLYHDGYRESCDSVYKMEKPELLALLDALFGRKNLPDEYTEQMLRAEAIRQVKQDFMTKEGREELEFWKKVMKKGDS